MPRVTGYPVNQSFSTDKVFSRWVFSLCLVRKRKRKREREREGGTRRTVTSIDQISLRSRICVYRAFLLPSIYSHVRFLSFFFLSFFLFFFLHPPPRTLHIHRNYMPTYNGRAWQSIVHRYLNGGVWSRCRGTGEHLTRGSHKRWFTIVTVVTLSEPDNRFSQFDCAATGHNSAQCNRTSDRTCTRVLRAGYICSFAYSLLSCADRSRAGQVCTRKRNACLALGPLPDYIYLNVLITPVKCPIERTNLAPRSTVVVSALEICNPVVGSE